MINKWNFQTPSEEELHKRDQLVAELGFSPVICLLLVQRGITSIEEAKKFFKPSLNDLHDPFLMPDMDKAVRRLNKALGNKEKILIYGDYDVDGTTAVSLVFKYLRPYSSTLDFYIPDRYDEGYGVAGYLAGLRYQSDREDRVRQGERHRLYYLRPPYAGRHFAGRCRRIGCQALGFYLSV